jgi:hypothetical protein
VSWTNFSSAEETLLAPSTPIYSNFIKKKKKFKIEIVKALKNKVFYINFRLKRYSKYFYKILS